MEDRVCGATITDTIVALNDWQLGKAWDKQIGEEGPSRLLTAYRSMANVYPQALCGALHRYMCDKKHITFPLRHTSRSVPYDGVVSNLIRTLGSLGYSIDTPLYSRVTENTAAERLCNRPHEAETWLSRVLPCHKPDLMSKVRVLLADTGITHMRDLLYPCGMRLLKWDHLVRRAENIRGAAWSTVHGPGNPKSCGRLKVSQPASCWAHIQQELLVTDPHLQGRRYVKPLFRDMPDVTRSGWMDTDGTEGLGWAAAVSEEGELHIYKDVVPGSLRGCVGEVEVWKYEFAPPNTGVGTRSFTPAMNVACSRAALDLSYTVLVCIEELPTRHGRVWLLPAEYLCVQEHVSEVTGRVRTAVYGSRQTQVDHTDTTVMPGGTNRRESATDGSMYTVRGVPLCGAAAASWIGTAASPVSSEHRHVPAPPVIAAKGAFTSRDPATLSSTHPEAEALLLALSNPRICPPGATNIIGIDNQGVLTAQSERGSQASPQTARQLQRRGMHYVQEITRHALSAETMEHTTLYKKAAHSDDPQNDWVDVYAKLSAGKSCARPPPRFPAQPADTLVHFHLYYHDSLVQDDVRAHVSKACEMHHLQSWASKPTHGHLQAKAESLNTSLLRKHATSRGWFTRKGERLLTKVVSGGLSTAARRAGRDATKQTSANCPLCGMGAGDTRHALLTCPHPELVSLREELTDVLVDTISDGLVRDSPYTEEHTLVAHPASLISPTSLYPYSTDFPALRPQDRTPLIKEFLPEGHLYLDGQYGTVTVRGPTPEVGARTVH